MPASRLRPHSPARYWRRNVQLIALLLVLWVALTAAPALFTGYLAFEFIGWPFPFWLAAYGAPLAFLLIVAAYGWIMNRADAHAAQTAGELDTADTPPREPR